MYDTKTALTKVANHQLGIKKESPIVHYDNTKNTLASHTEIGSLLISDVHLPLESGVFSASVINKIGSLIDKGSELSLVKNKVVGLVGGKKTSFNLDLAHEESFTDYSIYFEDPILFEQEIDIEVLRQTFFPASSFIDTNNPNSAFLFVGDLVVAHNTKSVFIGSIGNQNPDNFKAAESGFKLDLPLSSVKGILDFLKISTSVVVKQTEKGALFESENVTIFVLQSNKGTTMAQSLINLINQNKKTSIKSDLNLETLSQGCKISRTLNSTSCLVFKDNELTNQSKDFNIEFDNFCPNTPDFKANPKILEASLTSTTTKELSICCDKEGNTHSLLFTDYDLHSLSLVMVVI